MRIFRNSLGALAACLAIAAVAAAQRPKAQPAAKTDAQLRVDFHRAMADLVEARSAPQPDQTKIQGLAEKTQKLRAELAGPGPAGRGRGWGGPGRGFGPGYGRGAGWGFVDVNNNGICDRLEQATAPK